MATKTEEKAAVLDRFPENRAELIALMRDVYQKQERAAGKKFLTPEEIEAAFRALPGEECREYELAVAGFARDWADFLIKKQEEDDPEPPVRQILLKQAHRQQYDPDEEKIAFAAFAVAVNYERLHKNPDEEKKLLDGYRELFGKKSGVGTAEEKHEHVYFFHLDVLYRMDLAVSNNNDIFLTELLNDAKTNRVNLSKNCGGHHAFAEATALVFENAKDHLRQQLENAPEHWLEDAKTSAIKAIAQDEGYAKYYCTYGRILALCGEFDDSLKNISRAIALEKNTRTDYSIRIGQYSGYYQQIRAQQKLRVQEEAMAGQLREMKLAMEASEKETLTKNMEFLGLFAGIVSFTIGSLTITGAIASQSIRHAAGLIVVLMGALLCVFAAFGMILHGFHAVKRNPDTQRFERSFIWRHLVVFVLGIAVVSGGIWFCLM